jgi:hypothetical protein
MRGSGAKLRHLEWSRMICSPTFLLRRKQRVTGDIATVGSGPYSTSTPTSYEEATVNEKSTGHRIGRFVARAADRFGRSGAVTDRAQRFHGGWTALDRLRAAMLLGLVAVIVTGCNGSTAAQADAGPASPTLDWAEADPALAPGAAAVLAEVRRATQRFRDIDVAIEEGYVRDPAGMCIDAPMEGMPHQLGGLGIHYFRPDLLGITALEPRVDGSGTHTDFTRPAILVYEPQADGSLELVALENLVFVDAWHAAGNTAPPSFLGNEYYRMHNNPETAVDEAHGLTPHYELHVWLYRHNPAGTFMQFNPTVSCEHHRGHADTH